MIVGTKTRLIKKVELKEPWRNTLGHIMRVRLGCCKGNMKRKTSWPNIKGKSAWQNVRR